MATGRVSVQAHFEDYEYEFTRKIAAAGEELMKEISEEGVEKSIEKAPRGDKPDPRTPRIVDSINGSYTPDHAYWKCDARHGLIIEKGGGPAEITGRVYFYWNREQRWWNPGDNIIHHPPTRAKPYLKPALYDIMSTVMEKMRKHYPQ